MIDENEFFRNVTLKICGNLKIEEGLRDCIAYLSQHIPADGLYLERYEPDLGAMRIVVWATSGSGERVVADPGGQADRSRLGPLDHATGEGQLLGDVDADESREDLRVL